MLGFSIGKLLVTAVAILLVWYGFKYMGRMGEVRPDKVASKSSRAKKKKESTAEVEDLVECAVCGAFVSATGAAGCGRDDCPYPA